MIRTATRAMLFTFGLITLLLSSALIASGAFRPVRFFMVGTPRESWQPITLVSDSGGRITITHRSERAANIQRWQDALVWIDQFANITLWKNGERQQVGTLWGYSSSGPQWSGDGRLAWQQGINEGNAAVQPGVDLMVASAGSPPRSITPSLEYVTHWSWMANNDLWWIQTDPNQRWRLMRWDGQTATQLATARHQLTSAEFFPCGAALLRFNDTQYIYREGELRPIRTPSRPEIQLETKDCRAFLAHSVGPSSDPFDMLWESGVETRLSFDAQTIGTGGELVGIETPVNPLRPVFVYQHGATQQKHTWDLSQTAASPAFLFRDGASTLWGVSAGGESFLAVWNLDTDQLTHYPADTMRTDLNWHRSPVGAVWAESHTPAVVDLTLWQNEQITQVQLQLPAPTGEIPFTEARWMNDGLLLISPRQNPASGSSEPPYTQLYLWDGQTLRPLTRLPIYSSPRSDWMVWE